MIRVRKTLFRFIKANPLFIKELIDENSALNISHIENKSFR